MPPINFRHKIGHHCKVNFPCICNLTSGIPDPPTCGYCLTKYPAIMPVNASPATITINHNGFWCDFLNKSSQKASVLPIPYLKNPTTTPAINPTHNACSINLRLLFSPYLILSRFLIDINIILTQKATTNVVTF